MKSATPLAFYVPGNSSLHRLHIAAKFALVVLYVAIVFLIRTPVALIGLLVLVVITGLALRLRLRMPFVVGIAVVVLGLLQVTGVWETFGGRLVFGAVKILALTMLLQLFSMTTKLSQALEFLQPTGSLGTFLEPVLYIANTILVILPSIQYDMQRAVDAETIRRRTGVQFYSFGSWVTVLSVVLVRTLGRAERFTDTLLDRGYPSSGATRLSGERALAWNDVFQAALYSLPGLLLGLGLG